MMYDSVWWCLDCMLSFVTPLPAAFFTCCLASCQVKHKNKIQNFIVHLSNPEKVIIIVVQREKNADSTHITWPLNGEQVHGCMHTVLFWSYMIIPSRFLLSHFQSFQSQRSVKSLLLLRTSHIQYIYDHCHHHHYFLKADKCSANNQELLFRLARDLFYHFFLHKALDSVFSRVWSQCALSWVVKKRNIFGKGICRQTFECAQKV